MKPKELSQGISDADWAHLAELAGTTPDEIRRRYEEALEAHPAGLRSVEVRTGEDQVQGDCLKKDFEVSLFKIVGIKGSIEFCGPADNWSAKLHICLILAGIEVWCTDYTFSRDNMSICLHPDLAAVKATLCVGLVGTNLCFNVHGNACYWAFGWHCADFNETLFCFK